VYPLLGHVDIRAKYWYDGKRAGAALWWFSNVLVDLAYIFVNLALFCALLPAVCIAWFTWCVVETLRRLIGMFVDVPDIF
jgi:hypothetical protein